MATERDPQNIDLRLTFDKGLASITMVSELVYNGRVLVTVPTRNKAIRRSAAVEETTQVAASRLSKALAKYVASDGPIPAERERAQSTSIADEIKKLVQLRTEGLLTDAEFNAQKKKLLEAR